MNDRFQIDPLADLKNYREALRQMVEEGWVMPRDLMPSVMNAIVVPVDVLDNGPELVVKANLPGVQPQDVSIHLLGSTLTIKATLDEENDNKGATFLRRERKITAFTRTLHLPMPVEAERADASFKNGVLRLVLPKAASVRPRVIKVQPE